MARPGATCLEHPVAIVISGKRKPQKSSMANQVWAREWWNIDAHVKSPFYVDLGIANYLKALLLYQSWKVGKLRLFARPSTFEPLAQT